MVQAQEHTLAAIVVIFVAATVWNRYKWKWTGLKEPPSSPKRRPSTAKPSLLNGNEELLFNWETPLIHYLLTDAGQGHLFAKWSRPGKGDHDKRRLIEQLVHLDKTYAGGLRAYLHHAKQLLAASKEGTNPYEGWTPEVPRGEKLDFGSHEFIEYERLGVQAAGKAAFVLVAGGLGERLGYSGIKLALPADSARGKCYLQVYAESILALQNKAREEDSAAPLLPLVIMTSDDTHARTQQLLDENGRFGLSTEQVHLLKQEKVACLADNNASLALDPQDPYQLQTKPHGHGDVHSLLHSHGLVEAWRKAGIEWVCFFQDTNGLVFRGLPAALGVSARHGYDVNSLCVPRKAGEAIGGIALLRHARSKQQMTINVEYNQLEPLLRSTGDKKGDVNDSTGYSPYPGNINQFILKASSYATSLAKTRGLIAEFVNPKYADAGKTAFKSSTRLECMMQDYPKALSASAAVGFTQVNQVWSTYSPVKNSPADALAKVKAGGPSHSATSGELDIYKANCRALQMTGAVVDGPRQATFNGIDVELWPRVSWSPHWAMTFDDLQDCLPSPHQVHIHRDAAMVVEAHELCIQRLDLAGALVIEAVPGAHVNVEGLRVSQPRGWEWQALREGADATEEERIRGFRVIEHQTEHLTYRQPGEYGVGRTPPPSPGRRSKNVSPAQTPPLQPQARRQDDGGVGGRPPLTRPNRQQQQQQHRQQPSAQQGRLPQEQQGAHVQEQQQSAEPMPAAEARGQAPPTQQQRAKAEVQQPAMQRRGDQQPVAEKKQAGQQAAAGQQQQQGAKPGGEAAPAQQEKQLRGKAAGGEGRAQTSLAKGALEQQQAKAAGGEGMVQTSSAEGAAQERTTAGGEGKAQTGSATGAALEQQQAKAAGGEGKVQSSSAKGAAQERQQAKAAGGEGKAQTRSADGAAQERAQAKAAGGEGKAQTGLPEGQTQERQQAKAAANGRQEAGAAAMPAAPADKAQGAGGGADGAAAADREGAAQTHSTSLGADSAAAPDRQGAVSSSGTPEAAKQTSGTSTAAKHGPGAGAAAQQEGTGDAQPGRATSASARQEAGSSAAAKQEPASGQPGPHTALPAAHQQGDQPAQGASSSLPAQAAPPSKQPAGAASAAQEGAASPGETIGRSGFSRSAVAAAAAAAALHEQQKKQQAPEEDESLLRAARSGRRSIALEPVSPAARTLVQDAMAYVRASQDEQPSEHEGSSKAGQAEGNGAAGSSGGPTRLPNSSGEAASAASGAWASKLQDLKQQQQQSKPTSPASSPERGVTAEEPASSPAAAPASDSSSLRQEQREAEQLAEETLKSGPKPKDEIALKADKAPAIEQEAGAAQQQLAGGTKKQRAESPVSPEHGSDEDDNGRATPEGSASKPLSKSQKKRLKAKQKAQAAAQEGSTSGQQL